MRSQTPTLHCDYLEDEWDTCTNWDVDYYACDVYAVNGVRITTQVRAPGWWSWNGEDDYCPEHHD